MPTTNSSFGFETTATEVAAAFSSQIQGKTILITGINALGLGGTTTWALAAHSPKCLILAGRTPSKIQEVIDAVKDKFPNISYKILELDLSSQQAVRASAKNLLSWKDVDAIDILINNAGVMAIPTKTLSADGLEMQFATNHVGHFLFTNLILSKLITSASSTTDKGTTRIVNLSSRGTVYSPIRFSDYNFETINSALPKAEQPDYAALKIMHDSSGEDESYVPMAAYGQSKTANILFSLALTKRLYASHGILSLALHPGGIRTELSRQNEARLEEMMERFKKRGIQFKNLEQGCSTTLVTALDPALVAPDAETARGVYLSDCQIAEAPAWSENWEHAESLWPLSEKLVGEKFQW